MDAYIYYRHAIEIQSAKIIEKWTAYKNRNIFRVEIITLSRG